jgi:hypothetical protein
MNSAFCFALPAHPPSGTVIHARIHFEGARCAADGAAAVLAERVAGEIVALKIGCKIVFAPI